MEVPDAGLAAVSAPTRAGKVFCFLCDSARVEAALCVTSRAVKANGAYRQPGGPGLRHTAIHPLARMEPRNQPARKGRCRVA